MTKSTFYFYALVTIAFLSIFSETPSGFSESRINPPENLQVEASDQRQVTLSWNRDKDQIDESVDYYIYQKFYNIYGTYQNYGGYGNYSGYGNYDIYVGYGNYLTYNRYDRFTAGQYSDQFRFQRIRKPNQYLLLDTIRIQGDEGYGSDYGNYNNYLYYGIYGAYSAYPVYWKFNEDKVYYSLTNPHIMNTDYDETGRASVDPVFKVVAVKENNQGQLTHSVSSAEARGLRETGQKILPAPEDVTVQRLENGNVLLNWQYPKSNKDVYKFRIYKSARALIGNRHYAGTYDNYIAYEAYGQYVAYPSYNLLGVIKAQNGPISPTPMRTSYKIDSELVSRTYNEYWSYYDFSSSAARINELGVYKVVAEPKDSNRSLSYSASSPESRYAKPTLYLEKGTSLDVCVGRRIAFVVNAHNALNEALAINSADIGGTGIDVDIFSQSALNLYPAFFVQVGGDWLFSWRPSHFVSDEMVEFLANDQNASGEEIRRIVTLRTVNC